jgi:hypothetical protein
MDTKEELEGFEEYVDFRNQPALRGKHGGKVAAFFVLGNLLSNLEIRSLQEKSTLVLAI